MLLLESPGISIEQIQACTQLAKQLLETELIDIVPSYDSIALFYVTTFESVLNTLEGQLGGNKKEIEDNTTLEIPICFELGLDLDVIAKHASLRIDALIERYSNRAYTAALIGFTPGFIYLSGLDKELSCPRRSNPRSHLAAGSVGIGGDQTGIYSLNSPGGWNIIGRTPHPLFDVEKQPPLSIEIGTKIVFKRISQKEFEEWES